MQWGRRLLALSAVATVLCVPVAVAQWTEMLDLETTVQSAYINGDFTGCSTNDPPGTLDAGWAKDVGWSECALLDGDANGKYDLIAAQIHNAYPGYEAQFTAVIHNGGTLPERIASIDVEYPAEYLEVDFTDLVGTELEPGRTVAGVATARVLQPSAQGATYPFKITISVCQWLTGTIGFWSAWNNHNTYSRASIETWLREIDDTSVCLGPRTADAMQKTLKGASGGSSRERFLGHYLATRLNGASGRLAATEPHDVRSADPTNYLGLSHPSEATVGQIVGAIESKSGMSLSNAQYLILKSVCDGLNTRQM